MSDFFDKKMDTLEGRKGGCFPAGILISTPTGQHAIEGLVVGDEVNAYDKLGVLSVGTVSEVFKHKLADTDNKIIMITHSGGVLLCTDNHWIQTYIHADDGSDDTTLFVEADAINNDDFLVHEDGSLMQVHQVALLADEEYVYNLTVTPHHTFIADGVRVHNKGGGKKSRTPVEEKNTLQSRQVVRVLEVVSEGEIESIDQVYFDDTPIDQYEGAKYTTRLGLPSQTYLPGFSSVEAEVAINVEATFDTPVARQVSGSGIDGARVTVGLSALYKNIKSNGDLVGESVTIAIDVKSDGGSYFTVVQTTINGKTMSPYEESYRVNSPDGGASAWWVRVRRLTADRPQSDIQDNTFFTRLTEIQDVTLAYPDSAYVGVEVDAESTGGGIPRRSYDVRGIKVVVPSNYNAVTNFHSGIWNGTFKAAVWTDNPAWILYDLLTHTRYGMGIDPDLIDKFSFYNASVYNDGLVDDGNDNIERRFTFNAVINSRTNAIQLLQAIASAQRAALMQAGGVVELVQDRPSDPVKFVTNANVLDGLFEYKSSGLKARHNSVNVIYNDANDRYLTKTVTEEDQDSIARYGFNKSEVIAFGSTSEGQARRVAKWIIDTENNSTETATWKAFIAQADVNAGDVIEVFDRDYSTIEWAGKLKAGNTPSEWHLDRELTLTAGKQYAIHLIMPDGTREEIFINEHGVTTSVVSGQSSAPDIALTGADWAMSGPIQPRQFQIINIREDDSVAGTFEFTAIFHDPNKYARVEQGIVNPTPVFTDLALNSVSKMTGLVVAEESYAAADLVRKRLRVTWDDPDSQEFVLTYDVTWSRDNLPYQKMTGITQSETTIDDIVPGVYQIQVVGINVRGVRSPPSRTTYSVDTETGSSLNAPVNLYVTNTTGTEFAGNELSVSWEDNPTNSEINLVDTLNGWELEVWNVGFNTILRTERIPTSTPSFIYPIEMNRVDFGDNTPSRYLNIKVYALDAFGRRSSPIANSFSNPLPETPNFTVRELVATFWVNIIKVNDNDLAGYVIARSPTSGFTPTSGTLVYSGPDNIQTIDAPDPSETYYIRVAAYDTFETDLTTLNYSNQQAVTAFPIITDFEKSTFSGLTFTPDDPSANKVSWTAGEATSNDLTYPISAGNATWTTDTLYLYYLAGQTSIRSSTNVITASQGTVLATYKGGTDLIVGNGNAIIDGGTILANTIGATQLVANTAVITGAAQIKDGIIENAKIKTAAITTLKLEEGSVSNIIFGARSARIRINQGGQNSGAKATLTGGAGFTAFQIPTPTGYSNGDIIPSSLLLGYDLVSSFIQTYARVTFDFTMSGGNTNLVLNQNVVFIRGTEWVVPTTYFQTFDALAGASYHFSLNLSIYYVGPNGASNIDINNIHWQVISLLR